MIENIVSNLLQYIEKAGYTGVFISMFIESFFAPIPSELILPFAGFISASGGMNIVFMIFTAAFASFLGSLPFYFLGYWGNDFVLNKFISKYGKYLFIKQVQVDKGIELFEKYGKGIVLIGRIIPIIRTVISFPAGLVKMNFTQFTVFTLFGSAIWSSFLASAGYLLGENWESVRIWISDYEKGVIFLILFVVSIYSILALAKIVKANSGRNLK